MRRRSIVPALAVALVAATAVEAVPSPVRAAEVPTGFADAKVADIARPTAVEWLPSDQIVVLEQGGRVRVARPGEAFTTALTLSGVCSNGERGLLGFTHDPAFLHNGLVYVYYTRQASGAPGGCVNRVSRFTMSGATIERASEVVLLDNISSVAGITTVATSTSARTASCTYRSATAAATRGATRGRAATTTPPVTRHCSTARSCGSPVTGRRRRATR